jgi:hypothetical protein
MQPRHRICYFKNLLKAQHVSSGIPLINWVPTQPEQRPVTTWVYKPKATNTVWSSWWWAVCRSKHVEPSINFGIINSITGLHLVGYFYWFRPQQVLLFCTFGSPLKFGVCGALTCGTVRNSSVYLKNTIKCFSEKSTFWVYNHVLIPRIFFILSSPMCPLTLILLMLRI